MRSLYDEEKVMLGTIGGLLFGFFFPLMLAGCTSIGPAIETAIGVYTNQAAVVTPAQPGLITVPGTPPPIPQPQTLWPAYSCPNFAKHGYEGESQFRTDAMIAAQKAGFDAIAIKFIPNEPPARIEIYEWESNVDKGKFRPNCARQAREYGITKWVMDISGVDLELVRDTFKAYSPDGIRVQFTGISLTSEVKKILECDGQGIKTTPPRYR